jgi:hypothetical protein
MRWALFALAWTFIFAAALHDADFAWQNRAELQTWELNPVARWATEQLGLGAVFGFKLVSLLFAAGLAVYCRCRRRKLERPLTLIIAGVYALLCVHYVLAARRPEPRVVSRVPAPHIPVLRHAWPGGAIHTHGWR